MGGRREEKPEWDAKGLVQDLYWIDADGGEALRRRFEGDHLHDLICYLTKLSRTDSDDVVHPSDLYYVKEGKLFRKYPNMDDLEVLPVKAGKDMAKLKHATNGHLGPDLTWKALGRTFNWSSMRADIKGICGACDECRKNGTKMRQALVHILQRFGPFDDITLDHLSMPRTGDGCGHLVVAVDIFTKFVWAWCHE